MRASLFGGMPSFLPMNEMIGGPQVIHQRMVIHPPIRTVIFVSVNQGEEEMK